MINKGRLLLVAAGVLLVAGVGGWLRPIPSATGASNAQQSRWRLPSPAEMERSSIEQFAATHGVAWVGDGAGGAGGGAVAWTLRGIVGPNNEVALVQAGSDPLIKRVRSGDILPDGSKVVAVLRSSVVVERDGCQTRRPLYRLASAAAPDPGAGCSTPGTNKDTPQP